jgi:N-acetylneuraminate synthase
MVDRTRDLEASLGNGLKQVEENEMETVALQRRSICATNGLQKGHKIALQNLTMLRPCPTDGIPPFESEKLIGKRQKRNISSGEYKKLTDIV